MGLENPSNFDNAETSRNGQALIEDPIYQELVLRFQKAEWLKCNNLIHGLLEKYPSNPVLVEFKNDLDTQLLFNNLAFQETKYRERKKVIRLLSYSIITGLLFVALGWSANWYFTVFIPGQKVLATLTPTVVVQEDTSQIDALNAYRDQVLSLLKKSRPEFALEVIKQMQAIDPEYPGLQELLDQANKMAKLDEIYRQAIQNTDSKQFDAALVLFEQIQSDVPNYKDVESQIANVKKGIIVTKLLTDAEKAFQEGRWADVIQIYEESLVNDPTIITDKIKEELLNSYLKSIISMLEGNQTSMENIIKSEGYYKKAISLFPQSKEYAKERESLQKLSVNLLTFKYFQAAEQIIDSKNCSEEALRNAVNYLEKANYLDPNNETNKTELLKAQNFLNGTRYFNQMAWEKAIVSLSALYNIEKTYANGNLKLLLYEAYSTRGRRYFSLGLYVDARIDFEAAEAVIFDDHGNLLQRFQVDLNIGYALGKIGNYKDSASYFKYALESIDITNHASNNFPFLEAIKTAEAYFTNEQFVEAYSSYVDALTKYVNTIYTFQKVEVPQGSNLVFIAGGYNSTVQGIQENNKLDKIFVLTSDQTLSIPTIK